VSLRIAPRTSGSSSDLSFCAQLQVLTPSDCTQHLSRAFRSSLEFTSGLAASPFTCDRSHVSSSAPPAESLAPIVFSHTEQRLFRGSGLPAKAFSPTGFPKPHDAFIRPMSASLFSCWIHVWGSNPSKPFSSSAAVRRLRRPCPLVVVTSVLPRRLSPTLRSLGVLRARSAALRMPLAFRALLCTRICHFVSTG